MTTSTTEVSANVRMVDETIAAMLAKRGHEGTEAREAVSNFLQGKSPLGPDEHAQEVWLVCEALNSLTHRIRKGGVTRNLCALICYDDMRVTLDELGRLLGEDV